MEIKVITVTFRICETPNVEMRKPCFDKKFGIVRENIEVENPISIRAYYPLYLVRRFLYAFILAALHEYPKLQLWLITFAVIFPVLFKRKE